MFCLRMAVHLEVILNDLYYALNIYSMIAYHQFIFLNFYIFTYQLLKQFFPPPIPPLPFVNKFFVSLVFWIY